MITSQNWRFIWIFCWRRTKSTFCRTVEHNGKPRGFSITSLPEVYVVNITETSEYLQSLKVYILAYFPSAGTFFLFFNIYKVWRQILINITRNYHQPEGSNVVTSDLVAKGKTTLPVWPHWGWSFWATLPFSLDIDDDSPILSSIYISSPLVGNLAWPYTFRTCLCCKNFLSRCSKMMVMAVAWTSTMQHDQL